MDKILFKYLIVLILILQTCWQVTQANNSNLFNDPQKNQNGTDFDSTYSCELQKTYTSNNNISPNQVNLLADKITGNIGGKLELSGDAEILYNNNRLKANSITFDQRTNDLTTNDNFSIQYNGNVITGTNAITNIKQHTGSFKNTTYDLANNKGLGDASKLIISDKNVFEVYDTRFSTCRNEKNQQWHPDWHIQARQLNLDLTKQIGIAKHSTFRFKNIPLFYWPYLSFPLDNQRKTGLLNPSVSFDNTSGIEFKQPFYWNMAPNYDLTITPSILTKRGVNFTNNFRFLTKKNVGQISLNVLPKDKINNSMRWSVLANHHGTLFNLFNSPVKLSTRFNKVSDNNYWQDALFLSEEFQRRILDNHTKLNWQKNNLQIELLWQKWQVLKNPTDKIITPFNLNPQLTVLYRTGTQSPLSLNVAFVASKFTTNDIQKKTNEANRYVSKLGIEYNLQNNSYFVHSNLSIQNNQYIFKHKNYQPKNKSFTTPSFSIDAGLFFERYLTFKQNKNNFLQTLEPRVVYSYTPYRQQDEVPSYDSEQMDFNLSSIFLPNTYSGYDKIPQNNLLTFGVGYNLINTKNQRNLIELQIAQRLSIGKSEQAFTNRKYYVKNFSDLIAGGKLNFNDKFNLNFISQHNYTNGPVNTSLGINYQPQADRWLNASYTRKDIMQRNYTLFLRWPLNIFLMQRQKWYFSGYIDYDLKENKITKTKAGLIYENCCWNANIMLEALPTYNGKRNKKISLQIDLLGLTNSRK